MPTRPTSFMSPIFAMPTTTVLKMIGAIIILISLMKPSPSGFIVVRQRRVEVAEGHADRDRDEHLKVQVRVQRLMCRWRLHDNYLRLAVRA